MELIYLSISVMGMAGGCKGRELQPAQLKDLLAFSGLVLSSQGELGAALWGSTPSDTPYREIKLGPFFFFAENQSCSKQVHRDRVLTAASEVIFRIRRPVLDRDRLRPPSGPRCELSTSQLSGGPEAMSEYPRFTSVSADETRTGLTYLVFYFKQSAGAVVEGPRRCSIHFESKEEALQMPNIERAWAEVSEAKQEGPIQEEGKQRAKRLLRSRAVPVSPRRPLELYIAQTGACWNSPLAQSVSG